jgi:hypothetical protein
MKSSFPSVIPFLPLFCNCHFEDLTEFSSCFQVHILAGWRPEIRSDCILRERERLYGGGQEIVSGFEGSQAVPACPSVIGIAYDKIF